MQEIERYKIQRGLNKRYDISSSAIENYIKIIMERQEKTKSKLRKK